VIRRIRGRVACSLVVAVLACGGGGDESGASGERSPLAGTGPTSEVGLDTTWVLPGTAQDWEVLRGKVRWGRENGLDTLPVGTAMARLGVTFVGTTYLPGTLETEGDERVVVNLLELDCVTFVENVMAITDLIRDSSVDPDARDEVLVTRHAEALKAIRYRDGELDGYPSRLHYFSEWIGDHDRRGLVNDVTQGLGGAPYPDPVDFMSRHAEAYPHLADPGNLAAIQAMEARLASAQRSRIPQEHLPAVADQIQDGDIIAATSTVEGLDIAHTGLALWVDGRLHLLHAPLVGRAVEISEVPLAERIVGISGQDGVMVARPTGRALTGEAR